MCLYYYSYKEITPKIRVNQRVLANREKESSKHGIARASDETPSVSWLTLSLRYHVKCEYLERHIAVSLYITTVNKLTVNLRVLGI